MNRTALELLAIAPILMFISVACMLADPLVREDPRPYWLVAQWTPLFLLHISALILGTALAFVGFGYLVFKGDE